MNDFVLEILENNQTVHAFSSKDLHIIFNDIKNYRTSKNEKYILQFWCKEGNIRNIIETNNIQDILDLDIYYILEIYKKSKLIYVEGTFLLSKLKINYKEDNKNNKYSLIVKINSEFFELLNTKLKNIINTYIKEF
tara:strand:+ start:177 stop:584 length:408 start_codon:yes stop_codon:yes gene_type:complete